MKRRTLLFAALGLSMAGGSARWLLGSSTDAPNSPVAVAADLVFGTTASLQVRHEDPAVAHAALTAAMTALKEIDALMSLYRPDSQVSQLNREGKIDRPDARLVQVLQTASQLARDSDGAFDVTVQPLWHAHAIGSDASAVLERVNWRKLAVSDQQVRLADKSMAITLNGLAQGYGVDQAMQALRQHGIRDALLDTGEFGALGVRDDGSPWTLGIRHPRKPPSRPDADPKAYAQVIALDGRCMATSGDYATRFTTQAAEDFSQHHIFDPRTGQSPAELASVTVLAPSGILADGLATACMVLGAEKSLALAAHYEQVDIFCIDKAGHTTRSAGFPPALSVT